MTINSFWQGWVFAAAAVSGLLIISPVANGADLKAAEKVLQRGYYEVAEREIEPAALSGNAHAQFLMGELYQRPNFWKCRLETSLAWYEKSADQGYARANTRLGFIYRYGLGVEKDPARAFVLFKRAAFSGDPSAQKLLGEMYLGGVAGSRDVSEAAYWLQKAAKNGSSFAISVLARMYADGTGLPRNPEKAYSLLQNDFMLVFDAEGRTLLGKLMIELEVDTKKKREGLKLIQEAAERGEPKALILLAELHRQGTLVEKDIPRAEELASRASDIAEERQKWRQKKISRPNPCTGTRRPVPETPRSR